MSSDSTRMCELLVGLPDVNVLEVVETDVGLRVTIETRGDRPLCVGCGGAVKVKDRRDVEHADLPCFGLPTVLVWRKIRWECSIGCGAKSSTETAAAIAAPRQRLTDRAGRWATVQVGRRGRPVSDVASELGAGWDPVMDAVVGYGQVLIDDPGRFGDVEAIGLDETLRCKTGRWKAQQWSTQIVDVGAGQLLDVVEGRNSTGPCEWFAEQPQHWLDAIRWAALDLSGPYRLVFNTMIPAAVQVADPFHVHKLANTHLDECRRRVQNETMGHRGRKDDPLYRCRRLLTKADERLDERGQAKLLGLLQVGDPRGEVKAMWHAKQVVRSIYDHRDPVLALEFVTRLGRDLQDEDHPVEAHQLGRTLLRWRHQICAWHASGVTNGPTEGVIIWSLFGRVFHVADEGCRGRGGRVLWSGVVMVTDDLAAVG